MVSLKYINEVPSYLLKNFTTHNPKFLTPLEKKTFENIEGKGEHAGNQHVLLFPQCFQHFPT